MNIRELIFGITASALLSACGAGRYADVRVDQDTTAAEVTKADRTLRLMTYNVCSFSNFEDDGVARMGRIISGVQPDAISLNEVDSVNVRHKVDQLAQLASVLGDGWQQHFGAAMTFLGGSYGNGVAVCPSDRIIRKCTIPLSKSSGSEPRSVAVVETGSYVFGSCHLDFKTEEARQLQIKELTLWFERNYKGSGKPVFLCGDLNAEPGSETLQALLQDWELLSPADPTFPAESPNICIDYILRLKSSAPVRVLSAKVITSGDFLTASDHLPVIVEVKGI